MLYSNFKGNQLSRLGFGIMRMPTCDDGSIDMLKSQEMVAYAIENGVNYFDTAYMYHDGESERAIGKLLAKYPRSSWYLASKFPGHQISSAKNDPAKIFEEQLQKCGVEYFDFYLLHNVSEISMDVYLSPEWGIIDYLKEQKRLGRIKHLGFSCHAETAGLKHFLDARGDDMEFCQIQLNYLDWTMQDAKGKYELLTQRNIPVWVMEPVRGGKLAKLSEPDEAALKAIHPEDSIPTWCFRFLQGLPNVQMVLSGMSNMDQIKDNIKTFSVSRPLSETEFDLLQTIAEKLKNAIPCTGCRYCCDGCPQKLDIPALLSLYNEMLFYPSLNLIMRAEFIEADKKPSNCIACGKCKKVCPQNIDIPGKMKEFDEKLQSMPTWTEICRRQEQTINDKK